MNTPNRHRRLLLKALGTLTAWAATGLTVARAARSRAFEATALDRALAELGVQEAEPSEAIQLTVPPIPENAVQVPVVVETTLPRVERIRLLVADNPWPLAVDMAVPPDTLPYLALRLKVRQSTEVIALVRAGGRDYSARRSVRVVESGCDG